MDTIIFVRRYFRWHYSAGLRSLRFRSVDFFRFLWRLFAPLRLLADLFAPLQRLQESYPDNFDLSLYTQAFVINSLMRVVGIVARILLVGVGLCGFMLAIVAVALAWVVWLLLPLLTAGIFGAILAFVIG